MAHLPRARTVLSIESFDGALADTGRTCDLRTLKFIDAYGLVALACALRAARAFAKVEVVTPRSRNTASHLAAMGFGDFLSSIDLTGLPATGPIDAADVVVTLQSAADSGGAQTLSNLLWEQLRDHVAPEVLQAITEGVWEMVANALEHSGTDALIMGQVYREPRGTPPDHDDRVQIVIGDTGRGIRQSFLATATHTPPTDLEAIGLALEYLVTSVPDDPGRGQGLSTTAEQVLETQGRMIVRSGTAKVSLTAEDRTAESVPFLPGVIVALSLPLYPG